MVANDPDAVQRDLGVLGRGIEDRQARRRFTPGAAMRCPSCGLILHAATIQHEHALVFASCCPRCDGPLPPIVAGERAVEARSEPSIYLG
jgi:hypothetical protein